MTLTRTDLDPEERDRASLSPTTARPDTRPDTQPHPRKDERLPMAALLALAFAAFITILTEALPAGLLPQMSAGLGTSEAMIGQLVTAYALGSLVAAIPLTAATRGLRRRPLLLVAVGGFALVNTVTALSGIYAVTLVARFVAGVFAGLLWALAAGYAARMVPEHLEGKAIAVAMAGAPLALSLGIPAGTLLGTLLGWRLVFGVMSLATLVLVGWVWAKVPDFPGQSQENRQSLVGVFTLPGLPAILFVTLSYVLAHNILYTYIAPFLAAAGLGGRVDAVLAVFGLASILGIWMVGVLIDRWLRQLMLAVTLLFAASALALGLWGSSALVVYAAIAVWGLAFGGVATLVQTASAKTAGPATDAAQSMIVTVWNAAIAGGGIIGGLLLEGYGTGAFAWVVLALLVAAFAVTARTRHGAFAGRN